ncbi:nitroreductase family protein [Pacificibacter marinus]|uniref:nitroreductase family protein n=1 Tax=Pacificibacter marinus TaxID=658057 RepID=UPI001C073585|nr:nitroreductase family protein [Pacificibacter marinus]MBU2865384.1 nitroreductase family protein [Pacificibacter marinus]
MLKDLMQWRYATKKYDPSKKIPAEQLEAILDAISLAPTSSGSQPFEVFVVSGQVAREGIPTMGMNESLMTDCSHVLVFAAWDNYTAERIDAVRERGEVARGGPTELATAYYEGLKSLYLSLPEAVNAGHAARQAYIALGFAMLAAAEQAVDATPIEGFDPAAVDEALGLAAKGLKSQVILALGYRDEASDWLVNLPKVRKSREEMFTFVE